MSTPLGAQGDCCQVCRAEGAAHSSQFELTLCATHFARLVDTDPEVGAHEASELGYLVDQWELDQRQERLAEQSRPRRAKKGRGLRTRGVIEERIRPVRWLWRRRIPLGLISLVVGEEDVGKGTLLAWVIARATRGELDGNLSGEPVNVLVLGDEDGFESIWVPRIHAAGGDLSRLRTLDDGEYLDDLNERADDLSAAVVDHGIGLIVFDQLLDHVDGGKDGKAVYNAKAVRSALMPLRRVAGEHGIAATGLLHPIKGKPKSFRDLIAGSHAFNAVSRSSLLLGADPDDEDARVLVRGKGNHSAAPRSFEFEIGVESFDLAGHRFEMPVVAEAEEGDRTVHDLMKPGKPVTQDLKEQLYPLLGEEERKLADLARDVGREPRDGSVRNALKALGDEGRAEQGPKKGWKRCSR